MITLTIRNHNTNTTFRETFYDRPEETASEQAEVRIAWYSTRSAGNAGWEILRRDED